MFFVKKKLTALYLVRDSDTGQYMGFDNPSVYWSKDEAQFAIERQQSKRDVNKIPWEIVRMKLPSVAERD